MAPFLLRCPKVGWKYDLDLYWCSLFQRCPSDQSIVNRKKWKAVVNSSRGYQLPASSPTVSSTRTSASLTKLKAAARATSQINRPSLPLMMNRMTVLRASDHLSPHPMKTMTSLLSREAGDRSVQRRWQQFLVAQSGIDRCGAQPPPIDLCVCIKLVRHSGPVTDQDSPYTSCRNRGWELIKWASSDVTGVYLRAPEMLGEMMEVRDAMGGMIEWTSFRFSNFYCPIFNI